MLKTVTAFTLAHSLTLALATLGVVLMPAAPTEAVISLSIMLLAVEVVRKFAGEFTLSERYPWLVAFAFGLVHGLGFAGALSEIGVPQNDVPLALLMFNVGVETGQVLAMVNQPSYNPNYRVDLDLNAVRNRAMTDVFEPGSTVKPFTVGVALATGRYSPSSTIDTHPGFVRVGNFTVRDPSDRGVIDLGQVIAQSSQVGISKLALDLNEYEVWGMFEKVGFGRSVGTGFPGERTGYLPNHRRWKDLDRATFAYGYGLTVTPLQLAVAYLTIASGG